MLQSCKNLPLLAKSLAEDVSSERQVNQLDGDLLLEVAIGAMRQVNGAHSAAALQTVDLVRADATGFGSGFRVRAQGRSGGRFSLFRGGGFKQRMHLRRKL